MSLHLDPECLRHLLLGELPEAQEHALLEHLRAGDCASCEAALGSLDDADEDRLWRVLERCLDAEDLPAGRRAAVLAEVGRRRGWRGLLLAPALAAAAGLLLVAGLWWWWPTGEASPDGAGEADRGLKGEAARPPLPEVRLGVVGRSGPIRRGRDGQDVRPDERLVFQVRVAQPCELVLVRQDESLALERLLPAVRLEPGVHTPQAAGRPAGVALEGLRGEQWFAAVCQTRPLDDATLAAAMASVTAGGEAVTPDWSLALVRVRVVVPGKSTREER